MRALLVPIGNSRGIRIPPAIIKRCQFKKAVRLRIEGNTVIIQPTDAKVRSGWAQAFKQMHRRGEDQLIIPDTVHDNHEKDWEW